MQQQRLKYFQHIKIDYGFLTSGTRDEYIQRAEEFAVEGDSGQLEEQEVGAVAITGGRLAELEGLLRASEDCDVIGML